MTTTTTAPVSDLAERNRSVAREWIDGFNARDEREAGARAAGYIAHTPDSMDLLALDSQAWTEFLGLFLEGFPDLHLEVLDTTADAQTTAQRILFTGTHTGTFRGLPPTGRSISFAGIEINRMSNAKVVEHWVQLDALTLFQQLGLRLVPGPRLLIRILAAKVMHHSCGRHPATPHHEHQIARIAQRDAAASHRFLVTKATPAVQRARRSLSGNASRGRATFGDRGRGRLSGKNPDRLVALRSPGTSDRRDQVVATPTAPAGTSQAWKRSSAGGSALAAGLCR